MKPRIILLAHNIRSLWNVGSLFRTADCFAVEKIWCTGYTATPPRREISKTAIGAEEWILWDHCDDPIAVIENLKRDKWTIVALEQAENSVDLSAYHPPERVCLIVGHEVLGVPAEILREAEDIVHIPMLGRKKSLNVSIAAGIALHHLRCVV